MYYEFSFNQKRNKKNLTLTIVEETRSDYDERMDKSNFSLIKLNDKSCHK